MTGDNGERQSCKAPNSPTSQLAVRTPVITAFALHWFQTQIERTALINVLEGCQLQALVQSQMSCKEGQNLQEGVQPKIACSLMLECSYRLGNRTSNLSYHDHHHT